MSAEVMRVRLVGVGACMPVPVAGIAVTATHGGLHTAGYTREHMRTLAGADGLILLRHSEILDTHGHTRRTRADARGQVETDS
jgi:hypothetical protein